MEKGLDLVTGAGGFIGSHLVEHLLRTGRRVRALVRYASHGGSGFLAETPNELLDRLEIFRGDVTDSRAVRTATRGCERVFHLAALIGIPYSYVAPESYVNVNILGTLNILEAAREEGIDRLIVTSTSEVYGTAQFTPITEEHPLQGQSPYAATKIGADHLALSYQRTYGLPVAVARPFNTYGPRQSSRAVIPTIITQALFADEISIGSLAPVRDMVYVGDTVAGFDALAKCDACVGQATNLATGVAVSVGELIERITAIVGRELRVVESEQRKRPENSEVFTLLGSAAKAERIGGWKASVSLDAGLRKSIDWFRAHADPTRVKEYRV